LADVVTDLHTPRLLLHPIDVAEAQRITDRRVADDDLWAADFPTEGDIRSVTAYLRRTEDHGEQRPFGFYRITRASDGRAIGGIGFKSRPEHGSVEIGYGLAPSARGSGYAAEAAAALLTVATSHGLDRVVADTDRGNIASQRTLERAGFTCRRDEADLYFYEAVLGTRTSLHQSSAPARANVSDVGQGAPRAREP
jgi:RimJ/RimL family protein N-acetyltransferase